MKMTEEKVRILLKSLWNEDISIEMTGEDSFLIKTGPGEATLLCNEAGLILFYRSMNWAQDALNQKNRPQTPY
jgi:hypothetical protein